MFSNDAILSPSPYDTIKPTSLRFDQCTHYFHYRIPSSSFKSHLLLLLPLAVNLATSNRSTLKKTAHEIILVLDLPGFINSFNTVIRKLESTEAENRELKSRLGI